MMKRSRDKKTKFRRIAAVFLIAAILLPILFSLTASAAEPPAPQGVEAAPSAVQAAPEAPSVAQQAAREMHGVWFSFLDWQKFLRGKNEAQFKAAWNNVCDRAKLYGCNALFVHVRSHNDAAYPSAVYPWSTEMLNGNPGFDPLKFMVQTAHEKGLQFHAWINPYGYRNGVFSGDVTKITPENILAGIREILANYPVDGIHFDDYFPPFGKDFHNAMIRMVHDTVHAYGKVFGISPQGNLDNNRKNGVDVDTWLSVPGYIDYLCPQIYWSNQYGSAGTTPMYNTRLAQWTAINKLNLPLYAGLAGYRAGQTLSYDPGWALKNTNLLEQAVAARALNADGYLLYSYASLTDPKAAAEYANLLTLPQK